MIFFFFFTLCTAVIVNSKCIFNVEYKYMKFRTYKKTPERTASRIHPCKYHIRKSNSKCPSIKIMFWDDDRLSSTSTTDLTKWNAILHSPKLHVCRCVSNYTVMIHTTESKRHLSLLFIIKSITSMPEAVGLYMLISSAVLMVWLFVWPELVGRHKGPPVSAY